MTHGFLPHDQIGLFTDLYEFTMAQAYVEEGMEDEAVFSLFVRRLPARRNYLLACGQQEVVQYLDSLRFSGETLAYLETLKLFSPNFLQWLERFRFSGSVYAMPEGTPIFANTPILEVVAPLPQAQLVETLVMNQIHLQTVMASKAVRVVTAAEGRPVIDFGPRRMHGLDAGIKAARAFYIAGLTATSNVLAGKLYGIPLAGTMTHSYVQAHDDEAEAFWAFARRYPETILLVGTYDTLEGVRKVVHLAKEIGPECRLGGIRLDSGDLLALSRSSRRLLDEAGLAHVKIVASGDLDEDVIAELLAKGAHLDGFGIGTSLGVSADVPSLDIAYKLVAYAGRGRLKLSAGKSVLPGRKQVYRVQPDRKVAYDILARADEGLPGRPLLEPAMAHGRLVPTYPRDLEVIRRYARRQIQRLPDRIRSLITAAPLYLVEVSEGLRASASEVRQQIATAELSARKRG